MVWIKVCGITKREDALAISDFHPDGLGFVFYPKSKRYISLDKAGGIISSIRKKYREESPGMVGVFVNDSLGFVRKASLKLGLDYLQFSGDEDLGYLQEVKKDTGKKIIKSVRVETNQDILSHIIYFRKTADYILLDSWTGQDYGGSGIRFDWELAKDCMDYLPVILAGGLGQENISEAIIKLQPFGVDASSRLESSPGKKDIMTVREFISKARTVERQT
ncbi:MAG: phosphoribosylanthranilate isomerase [Candidatus Humimicrobiaceae bacterium]